MAIDYDLVLFGGTGAQFGHAVFETAGMGILHPPRRTFVVDADSSFFEGTLKTLHEHAVKEPAQALAQSESAEAKASSLPELHFRPPYSGPAETVTLLSLLGVNSLSPLGQACVTQEEAAFNIAKGLYGVAKLGGVLVAHERTRDKSQAGARFPGDVLTQLAGGSSNTPIVLAGSVAGGTGAGFLGPFLRALRNRDVFNSRPVYSFLFLPWFSLAARRDNQIGPDNLRMRRNASQGVRYAWHIHQDARLTAARTCTFIVGLPAGVKAPERSGDAMRSEPGPMLYYAASLLSGDFAALRDVDVAHQLPSGLFALRCNQGGPNVKLLRGRAQFVVEAVDAAGQRTVKQLPLEAARRLLRAQERALRNLSNLVRYEGAFGRIVDTPSFLPGIIYRALKVRGSTAERRDFGRKLAEAFSLAANDCKEQTERLTALGAAGRDLIDFEDFEAQLVMADWEDKALDDMQALDKLLARTPGLENKVTSQVGQSQAVTAARLLTRAVAQGLAGATGELARLAQATAATSLALPADVKGLDPSGPFAQLDKDAVDGLADALVAGDTPDSQCIPSPLAKAHVVDFMVRRTPLDRLHAEGSLARSDVGRIVLTFAGLVSGEWWIGDRLHLGASSDGPQGDALHAFDRLVAEGESSGGQRPMRATWIHLINSRAEGGDTRPLTVAATSPQTGFFPSVQVDEGTAPAGRAFQALEQSLRANNRLEAVRQALAVFVKALEHRVPSVPADWPGWYSILEGWTRGVDLVTARDAFDQNAFYDVGPFPLHLPNSPVTWVYLPRLMPHRERELQASLLATLAVSPAPIATAQIGNQGVEIHATRGAMPVKLMVLRPFGARGAGQTTDEELRGGALETMWTLPSATQIPVAFYGEWAKVKPLLRARLATRQRIPQPTLSMAGILQEIAARADFASALALDAQRVVDLEGCTPGPFSPGIVNLVQGLHL